MTNRFTEAQVDTWRKEGAVVVPEFFNDKEIKNLTIYKKGLFNSDFVQENELLDILNPVIKLSLIHI